MMEMEAMGRYCVGVDLGGTFIKFGALREDRTASETFQLPTPLDRGSEGVIAQIVAGAEQVIAREKLPRDRVVGVGIGSPGPIDLDAGVIISLPNIPGMDNCPLRDRVAERTSLPTVLENDANAAAYGEFVCGAGRDVQDMVMLTLGTGLGSGIILGGSVLHGSHKIGAELGHMIVDPGGELCGCGQKGCLERYCSATFLAAYAVRRIREGSAGGRLEAILNTQGALDAADVNAARREGDAFAAEVWDRSIRYLAIGCVNICRIFDPAEIVLAGGLTKAGDDLMVPLRTEFRRQHWTLSDVKTRLSLARLGTDAGVIGAAGVAWKEFETR